MYTLICALILLAVLLAIACAVHTVCSRSTGTYKQRRLARRGQALRLGGGRAPSAARRYGGGGGRGWGRRWWRWGRRRAPPVWWGGYNAYPPNVYYGRDGYQYGLGDYWDYRRICYDVYGRPYWCTDGPYAPVVY